MASRVQGSKVLKSSGSPNHLSGPFLSGLQACAWVVFFGNAPHDNSQDKSVHLNVSLQDPLAHCSCWVGRYRPVVTAFA